MSDSDDLSMFKNPMKTLYYFSIFLSNFLKDLLNRIAPVFLYLVVPMMSLYFIFNNLDGGHQETLTEIENITAFIVWWVGLGVLSSVGLGTGLHTGLLFLFPHIFKVSLTASVCNSTNFNSREMWFLNDDSLFVCRDQGLHSVPFWDLFYKVWFPCFLWGTGTALGEIPPYAISRAAKIAGNHNSEFEEITKTKSKWAIMDRMKVWMIEFLQRHGFLGIILMSSWPNAAFDLCGICCGHFEMPFWEFVSATWIGKALIKANLQAMFFLTVFTDRHLESAVELVEKIIPDSLEPCHYFVQKECHILIHELLHKSRAKFQSSEQQNQQSSWWGLLWPLVIASFLSFFILSCIEQFASYQLRIEMEKTSKKTNRTN